MSRTRYSGEFKVEAVRQVTERGHSVPEVAKRLTFHGELVHDPGTGREVFRRATDKVMAGLQLGGAGAAIAGEPMAAARLVFSSYGRARYLYANRVS